MIDIIDLPRGPLGGQAYKEAIEDWDLIVADRKQKEREDSRGRMLEDLDLIEYEPEPEN